MHMRVGLESYKTGFYEHQREAECDLMAEFCNGFGLIAQAPRLLRRNVVRRLL